MPRRPIDILNLATTAFLLLLAIVLAALGRLPDAGTTIAFCSAMLAGTVVVVLLARNAPPTGWRRIVADFYPVALVPQVFTSLQPLITGVGLPNQDAVLIAADRALFGVDVTVWLQRFVTPWLNDVMHVSYCTYYLFPLVVGVAMWRRSRPDARRFIFVCTLAFYVSYVGYFLVPARGPRTAQAALYTVSTRTTPVSRTIYDFLDHAEKTKDDAFPSGHNMIMVVCLVAAWRDDRKAFWPLLPVGLMLAMSTVYCRLHYVTDVIAGVGLAALTVPIGYVVYRRMAGKADRVPEVVRSPEGAIAS